MKASFFLCGLFLFGLTSAYADLYQWTDDKGVTHVVDDVSAIPESYRNKIKIYHAAKPTSAPPRLLTSSRNYPTKSQGAFAQKLALDLGLIKNLHEDALSPLSTIGIQPAGGWQLYDALTPEDQQEVIAAARRAAESQRIALSPDGAEAIVQRVSNEFLPPLVETLPVERYVTQEAPTIIVEQPPAQVIEVEREPLYIPAPVFVAPPWRGPGGGWHSGWHRREPQPPPRITGTPLGQSPTFAAPPPTHMPFGASHMPFGTHQAPFGSGR